MKHIEQVVTAVVHAGAHRATKFVSHKQVVRATRILIKGRLPRKGSNVEVMLTIGRPNYRERQFIKDCKKAGVSFPVRKVQLQALPRRGR